MTRPAAGGSADATGEGAGGSSRRGGAAAGKVWIVGAGPGDPELITVKARRLVDEADVILYDALVSVETLRSVRAECLFVGKRRGLRAFSQEEINEMLLEQARAGRRVVRLKGGDPFVFGRGGEEALYLRGRGIECEVVPGVSAALAAAADAQIPLTHRGVATSVALCAGVSAEGRGAGASALPAEENAGSSARSGVANPSRPSASGSEAVGASRFDLPAADTLAVYMAGAAVREVARQLLAQGRAPATAAALIHNATLADERVWTTTLVDLARGGPGPWGDVPPTPLVMIVGEVVRLGRIEREGAPAPLADEARRAAGDGGRGDPWSHRAAEGKDGEPLRAAGGAT